jgi:hypothetical protein
MSDSVQVVAVREQIEKIKSDRLSEQLKAFDRASLAWLAVVPRWTEDLAFEAGFPTGSFTLADFLNKAEDAGICERDKEANQIEVARLGARALMVFWPRLNDALKRKYAPALALRADLLPQGGEKRRMLREVAASSPSSGRTWSARVVDLFSSSSQSNPNNEVPGATGILMSALDEVTQGGARRKELWDLTKAAAVAIGAAIVPAVLRKLSEMSDAAAVLLAVAPLAEAFSQDSTVATFIENWAARMEPEQRAQMLLYVAPKNGSALGRSLQSQALAILNALQDPATRAAALLNALPELDDRIRASAIRDVLGSARLIESPAIRGQMIAATLPFLDLSERSSEAKGLVELSKTITGPRQRTSLLAAAAAALADDGQDEAAIALAGNAEDELARAQILLETVPQLESKKAERLRLATASLTVPALEEVLCNVSPRAAKEVAANEPDRVTNIVRSAASAGRFSTACKLAAMLTGRPQLYAAQIVLTQVRAIPTLKDRLQAIADIAAYLPDPLLDQACEVAARINASARFSIAEYSRSDIIEFLRKSHGRTFVSKAAVDAGLAIQDVAQRPKPDATQLDIPASTVRWAGIASLCTDAVSASTAITLQIRGALDSGAILDALEIVNTADDLARIIGAELEPAVAMGRHSVQLTFRQSADERRLARYLPRQEQIDDFLTLVNQPDEKDAHFALHYLGVGGVGKTMLLRYIAGRLAFRNQQKLPTTRIDFDHISPDYPARKPGELMAALADELRLWGGPDQESRFLNFVSDLSSTHAALAGDKDPHHDDDPLSGIRSDLFKSLLAKFASLLTGLPKPVIFILDTCEELVKLEPVGSKLTSIEATFLILEKLHDLDPGIRVVFAGRRLLARAGDKQTDGHYRWSADKKSLSKRNEMLPEAKDYLDLHIVRGFTEAESLSYLSHIAQLDLDKARREAVLFASPDPGPPADIVWIQGPAAEADQQPRYNPFDLSLYAEWLREVPDLPAEVIESRETDPYVQTRIEGRIFDENIRAALPAVVLMRRFNLDMLREIVNQDVALQVYRDLGSQEWIDYQSDALQLDLNLLPRLDHYFQHPSRIHLLAIARENLGPALGQMVRDALESTDPFGRLNVALVDAALRLLRPGEAAALWDRMDRIICDEANWNWAENLCRVLIEEDNAAGLAPGGAPCSNPLRAAVRATMAAARLHKYPFQPDVEWWKEIAATAPDHPDPEICTWLQIRARLVLENVSPEIENDLQSLKAGDPWRYEQAAAAYAAAVERHLEKIAALPPGRFRYDDAVSAEVRMFLAGLCAPYQTDFGAAKIFIAAGPETAPRQRWADWRAPASIEDRIRLEWMRHAPDSVNRTELSEWCDAAAARVRNSDSERLVSRLLEHSLKSRVPSMPDLHDVPVYDPDRKPVSTAARQSPPLFATQVEVLLARGEYDSALSLLNRVLPQATLAGDNEAISAIERLTLRTKRRMRAPDALSGISQLIGIENPSATRFHCWWESQVAGSQSDTENLIAAAVKQGTEALRLPDGRPDYNLALDARELDLLGARIGRPTDYANPQFESLKEEAADYRTELRRAALNTYHDLPSSQYARLDAAIAIEEGELLALRLPKLAEGLFHFAQSRFHEAGDPVGRLQSILCGALANTAEGVQEDQLATSSVILDLEDAYQACRILHPELPAWPEASEYNLPPAPSPGWDGWLFRITYAVDVLTGDSAGAKRRVAAAYNNVPQFDLGITAESPAPEPPKPSRDIRLVLYLTVANVFLFGALFVFQRMFHSVKLTIFDQVLAIMAIAIVLGLAAGVVIAAGIRMAPRLLYMQLCRAVPRILIQPSYSNPKNALIRFEVKNALWSLWPLFENLDLKSGSGLARVLRRASVFRDWFDFSDPSEFEQPAFRPYASAAGSLEKFSKPLHAIQRNTLLGPMPVALRVDRSLARYPWEAALTLAVPPASLSEPQFVRLDSLLYDEPERQAKLKHGGIQVTCRASLSSVMEQAWNASGRPVDVQESSSKSALEDNVTAVRHVIGTATRTGTGARFSLQRAETVKDSGVSLDVRSFGGNRPAVYIVQEEPAERLHRLDIDREQTAEARAWATELFYSGQQCVILIPTLPLALVKVVIETIAREIRRSRSTDLYRLIQLVHTIKTRIRSFRPPPETAGSLMAPGANSKESAAALKTALKELSLEVTLFARSKTVHEERYTGIAP